MKYIILISKPAKVIIIMFVNIVNDTFTGNRNIISTKFYNNTSNYIRYYLSQIFERKYSSHIPHSVKSSSVSKFEWNSFVIPRVVTFTSESP